MDIQKDTGELSTHLVVVIDVSPDSQILRKEISNTKSSSYLNWIKSIITFCNSHLMLNYRNQLTVIISSLNSNQIVFPTKANQAKLNRKLDGQYELFFEVTEQILNKIKELFNESKKVLERSIRDKSQSSFVSLLAGAVGIGLCRIQRFASIVDESRICILTSSKETPSFYASQYMNFMNSFFSAQKMRVAIDCCVIDDTIDVTNSILQQGCDLTNGFYLKINNAQSTLEYLIWVFLPSIETRKKMILPTKSKISYKASCFCHRKQVDIGYVCSVCLSIFCQFNPICSTCQTVFKLGPEPVSVKLNTKKRKIQS